MWEAKYEVIFVTNEYKSTLKVNFFDNFFFTLPLPLCIVLTKVYYSQTITHDKTFTYNFCLLWKSFIMCIGWWILLYQFILNFFVKLGYSLWHRNRFLGDCIYSSWKTDCLYGYLNYSEENDFDDEIMRFLRLLHFPLFEYFMKFLP